jgi:heme/copper-type cytochrome/quinol oxidase subunit 2
MKRRKKKILLQFLLFFFGNLILGVLTSHFFASKGLPPQSWQEIYEYLYLYIIISLIVAVMMTICVWTPDDKKEDNK